MITPFFTLPLLFGVFVPIVGQLTSPETAWFGQAVGGVSFGVLFVLLLRWLTGKWDGRQEKLITSVEILAARMDRSDHFIRDTIADWNRVQLLQMAERSTSRTVRESAKQTLAEIEARDKSPP